ncbi:putative short-chain dehydrogenase/reductase [Xylariaceae sp. FL1272]|nr:putative short-chain dehydrogenase/reductase [Xylariaceae sp. FL1272]
MSARRKTILITGCSQGGIGDALALEYHRRGLRVLATARDLAKVGHLKDLDIEVLRLDVVDKASLKKAVDEVSNLTNGTLDILVNNSGSGYLMPLLDADLDEARKIFEVNVVGTLAVCQAFTPLLAATARAGLPARIVNIGSVTSRMQVPWQGIYNASKAALHSMNDTLRIELAPFGVEVLHIITGGVQTKFFKNSSGAVLHEDSAYAPARDIIEADVAGKAATKTQTMSAEKYAEIVVGNSLRWWPSKEIWIGGRATLSWLGNQFLPATISDWIISNFMGWSFGGLKERLQPPEEEPTGK